MPTYAYRCSACGHEFDTVQRFSDAPLTACPECGGTIRRVFQPVGVVFKGSGWYINDSRSTTAASNGASDAATKKDGKTEGAKESSTPAVAKSSTSDSPSSTAKAAAD